MTRIAWMAALAAGIASAQIDYDAAREVWSLRSGAVEYRLKRQNGAILFCYLGPAGKPSWGTTVGPWSASYYYDISGMVDGQSLLPQYLTLASHDIRRPAPDRSELRLLYKHKHIPLEIEVLYTAWGDTGVFTRQVTYTNRGERTVRMEAGPSLSWYLPNGQYTLEYLHGPVNAARQLSSEKLTAGRRAFVSTSGKSSKIFSPWFSLKNEQRGVRFAAQLAYPGNWEMYFDKGSGGTGVVGALELALGMRFDFGGAAPLKPGASFHLPPVAFTASDGDLDDIANQFHRYQRRYVIPRVPGDGLIPTVFSSWHATPVTRAPKASDIKQYADYAADLGLEVVHIDSGWFSDRGSRKDPIFGDWEPDPTTFPGGLRDVADHIHAKGMKFGVWVEIETAALDSRVVREHPDWVLRYNGAPAAQGSFGRVYLDFSKPEVRRWARAVIDRLVEKEGMDYWRLDYNVNIGERYDPPALDARTGTVLYEHLRNFLTFLDEVRAAYPNLILENCAGGAQRFDLAMIAHTHSTWISDTVEPRESVQLAYGCTVEFTPAVCNHWMVGDEAQSKGGLRGRVDLTQPPGWWDFMFRITMNGQFGISSPVYEWNPELKKRAAENVALYKRLRPLISNSDIYHLTPPPEAGNDPKGWMALQYSSEDRAKSLVMAYRLGHSESKGVFRLRGLDPKRNYRIVEEGRKRGTFSGQQLSTEGLAVELGAEWRSAVIEIEAEP